MPRPTENALVINKTPDSLEILFAGRILNQGKIYLLLFLIVGMADAGLALAAWINHYEWAAAPTLVAAVGLLNYWFCRYSFAPIPERLLIENAEVVFGTNSIAILSLKKVEICEPSFIVMPIKTYYNLTPSMGTRRKCVTLFTDERSYPIFIQCDESESSKIINEIQAFLKSTPYWGK